MTITDAGGWEQRWLAYSRRVVTDTGHRAACSAEGGSLPHVGVFPEVRWPGYVGEHYEPGGMLFINIVHTDMATQWTHEGAAALAAATADWAAGRITDAQYLAANRTGYRAGLSEGNWHVGRDVRKMAAALGFDMTEIGYANAARCQVVPDGRHATRQNQLVDLCQAWLPIRELIEAIRPGLVYVTPSRLMPAMIGLPGDPLVVGIGQRGKVSDLGWPAPPAPQRWTAIAAEYRQWRHQLHRPSYES